MTLSILTSEEARQVLVDRQLEGLNIRGDEQEALRFSLLRQAVRRLAPCRRSSLVEAVRTSLRGLVTDDNLIRTIDADIDALIASGDVVVGMSDTGDRQRMMHAAAGMYVRRSPNSIFLIGHVPDEIVLRAPVTVFGPYREMRPAPPIEDLEDLGLSEYSLDAWLTHPAQRNSRDIADMLAHMVEDVQAGTVNNLEVVDLTRKNDYYVGRFVPPAGLTGLYIGRRRRTWGGSQWACVRLEQGTPARLVDLPALDRRFTGHDEAIWTICALDSIAGTPQRVVVERGSEQSKLSFFGPLPGWAEKRLYTVGRQSEKRSRGALMSVDVRTEDLEDELNFLRAMLWMEVENA